jgi:hypothetical protein
MAGWGDELKVKGTIKKRRAEIGLLSPADSSSFGRSLFILLLYMLRLRFLRKIKHHDKFSELVHNPDHA